MGSIFLTTHCGLVRSVYIISELSLPNVVPDIHELNWRVYTAVTGVPGGSSVPAEVIDMLLSVQPDTPGTRTSTTNRRRASRDNRVEELIAFQVRADA
jgi:hypothetical protein